MTVPYDASVPFVDLGDERMVTPKGTPALDVDATIEELFSSGQNKDGENS